jgi:hypothetical protein
MRACLQWCEISSLGALGRSFLLPPQTLIDRRNQRSQPARADRLSISALNHTLRGQSCSYCCPAMFLRAQLLDQRKNRFDDRSRTSASKYMASRSQSRLSAHTVFRQTPGIDRHIPEVGIAIQEC